MNENVLKEEIAMLESQIRTLQQENKELKERLDKIIEYTETLYSEGEICKYQNNKFINISQGKDE